MNKKITLHFVDAKEAESLEEETNALVKLKDKYDGEITYSFATYFPKHKEWVDEASLLLSGGYGGDITEEVIQFTTDIY